MSDCNLEDFDNGHEQCLLNYFFTGPQNPCSTGPETCKLIGSQIGLPGKSLLEDPNANMVDTLLSYGPYLPWPVNNYLKHDHPDPVKLPNKIISLPTEDKIIETPNTLIPLIELSVSVQTKKLLRFSGLAYCSAADLLKQSNWNAYTEETSNLNIDENRRSDIVIDSKYVGDNREVGKQIVIKGSYPDSALCGIFYKKDQAGIVVGLGFAFRKFYEPIIDYWPGTTGPKDRFFTKNPKSIETEYVGWYNDSMFTTKTNNYGWDSSYECPLGEFISQLTLASFDSKPVNKEIKASILIDVVKKKPAEMTALLATMGAVGVALVGLLPILTPILTPILPILITAAALGAGLIKIEVDPTGVGFKGVHSIRTINYLLDDGGMYRWIYDTQPMKCCTLLFDDMYSNESVEKFVCNNRLDLVVKNDWPNAYPNEKCRINYLQPYCNNKKKNEEEDTYNIESDLCASVCKLENTDCDIGIKNYCSSDQFFAENKNGIKKLDILAAFKDPICGCQFEYNKDNVLLSFSASVDLGISQNIKDEFKKDLSKTFREECQLATCHKSDFKLFNQKQRLQKEGCTQMDTCFGQGYQIPITKDNNTEIECKRFFQFKGECIDPLEPNVSILPNTLKQECRNIMKKDLNAFRTKPTECKLNTFQDPFVGKNREEKKKLAKQICYKRGNKLYYKQKKTVKIPSVPSNDPNLCPPFLRNADKSIKVDSKGNLMREVMEKEVTCGTYITMDEFNEKVPPPSTINMKTALVIFAMAIILMIIMFIIKKI